MGDQHENELFNGNEINQAVIGEGSDDDKDEEKQH